VIPETLSSVAAQSAAPVGPAPERRPVSARPDATGSAAGDPYRPQYQRLRAAKVRETRAKTALYGHADEDDYNTHIPPAPYRWVNQANHPDGLFYGFDACAENFYRFCDTMPPYVDKDSALAGGMYFFLGRLRTGRADDFSWNPEYPFTALLPQLRKYCSIDGIGAPNHMCVDFRIGLELGWGGLLDKIRRHAAADHLDDEQRAFYRAEELVVRGIQQWMRHTITEIDRLIAAEEDAATRANLVDMRECNARLVEGAPHTLRDACQFMAWFAIASRSYNRDGAGGQLDELLRPYYESDVAEGRVTDDAARYFIASLLAADTRYYQIGGPGPDGRDLTSRVSFLVLEACDALDVSCNITIRVHDGLDPELFDYGVECLVRRRNGWPRFSGDKALTEGFMRAGYPAELARRRIAVGCNWMALPGREYCINDCVKINLAKCFEIAFDEMMAAAGPRSTERLFELFGAHVRDAVAAVADGIDFHLLHQKHNLPEILLNLMCHGAIESGRDVSDGGVEFYNIGVDGAGNAVVADSLGALQERVEEQGRLTFEQVHAAVRSDFAGPSGERARLLLSRSSRYGSGNSAADRWAPRVTEVFVDAVRAKPTPVKGARLIPGLFSWSLTLAMGRDVGATPNGRHAGAPINHGANPLPGFRADGAATALSSAVASVQCGYGNTAPLQLELDPSITSIKDGAKRVGQLIRAHFELGGTLVNINIVDADKIRQAHADPALFPDLVVRVTGFTAYFSSLSPEFRQLVVDRLLTQ
jgi:formate C-acetyltransferase